MSQSTKFPTADTAISGSWTNPTNVQADDGSVASVTLAVKNTTVERGQGNFGFDGAIPSGAIIDNVAVTVDWRVSTTAGIAILGWTIGISGTYNAYTEVSSEPTTLTVFGPTNASRPGGGSWTRADLLDGTLTTKLEARSGNNATSVTYEYDYIKIIVDWHVPIEEDYEVVSTTQQRVQPFGLPGAYIHQMMLHWTWQPEDTTIGSPVTTLDDAYFFWPAQIVNPQTIVVFS